jgi:polyphosphate kinase
LPGISENIRVRSIVDRFLEHSRILVFGEGAKQQVFLSSADWMPRNFDRRVELMFPVEAEDLRWRIVEEIIPAYLEDNRRTRTLTADGSYLRVHAHDGETPRRSQTELLTVATVRNPVPPGEVASVAPVAAVPSVIDTLASTNGAPERDKKKKKDKEKKSSFPR